MKITFLLPGDSASGGARVTMQMGNRLIDRGHSVRIAYQRQPLYTSVGAMTLARSAKYRLLGMAETSWLSHFRGSREPFAKLEQLEFATREVVIATGEATNSKLDALDRNVLKLRYCHGFVERGADEMRLAWGGDTPTIAVSHRLLPTLERYCSGPIMGVVPNGISSKEYYVIEGQREGVGLIYSGHPIKGPEVAIAVLKALQQRIPTLPCHVFSSYPKPADLRCSSFTRFPSIEQARQIYNRCKVWLVTSRDEGFSLPILEAMSSGCAVVTSNHTNATDLIRDGINGFIVNYGDVGAYVKAVDELLKDEGRRRRFVDEGFRTANRFTWDAAADQMNEILDRLAKNGHNVASRITRSFSTE